MPPKCLGKARAPRVIRRRSLMRTVRVPVFDVASPKTTSRSKTDWLPDTYRPPLVLVITQSMPKSTVDVLVWRPGSEKVLIPDLKPQNHELSKSRICCACAL